MRLDKRAMSKAQVVLELVEYYLSPDNDNSHIFVKAYSNGREQGYNLATHWKAVSFSENRNSDHIVVYYGKPEEFSPQGNCPSEKIFKEQSKMFMYDSYYLAAEFIIKYLTT